MTNKNESKTLKAQVRDAFSALGMLKPYNTARKALAQYIKDKDPNLSDKQADDLVLWYMGKVRCNVGHVGHFSRVVYAAGHCAALVSFLMVEGDSPALQALVVFANDAACERTAPADLSWSWRTVCGRNG